MFTKLGVIVATTAAVTAPLPAVAAAGLDLHGEVLDLAVRPTTDAGDGSIVGGQANLSAKLPAGVTHLVLGMERGAKAREGAPTAFDGSAAVEWDSRRLGMTADWALSSRAKVAFTADSAQRSELSRGGLWSARQDHRVRSLDNTARIEATLAPLSPVEIRIGGAIADTASWSSSGLSGAPIAAELLHSGQRQFYAAGQWRPLSRLTLNAVGAVQTTAVDWNGASERAGIYTFVSPQLSASLNPWDGTVWRVGAERRIEPLDAGRFASFARAAEGEVGAAYMPDEEWRYHVSIAQKVLGEMTVNATLTRAAIGNATDLGPVGTFQAPVSIGSGERSELETAVTAPLAFGRSPLQIRAAAVWRASQVKDPFTGAPRRRSGETPYQAELTLSGLAGQSAAWAVSAQAAGSTAVYQMNQVTSRSAGLGLSGFLRFNHGPVAVQLNLDNLLGWDNVVRDTYFSGARALGQIERIDERRAVDRGVRIRLDRAL